MTLAAAVLVLIRVPIGQAGTMTSAPRRWAKEDSGGGGNDLEVACDDERKGAGAGVGADRGEDSEFHFGEAASGDR